MRRLTQLAMGAIYLLLRLVYVGALGVMSVWLVLHTFAPGAWMDSRARGPTLDPAVLSTPTDEVVDMYARAASDYSGAPRGHFHMTDPFLTRKPAHTSLCISCHGKYPHGKDEKTRVIQNMHAGFLDCLVCHVGPDDDPATRHLAWIDRDTGEVTDVKEGTMGKYPARIALVRPGPTGQLGAVQPIAVSAAEEFHALRRRASDEEIDAASVELHSPLAEEPVECHRCHGGEPYLDLASLGFPEHRIRYLQSAEVARMMEGDGSFHMPASVLGF